MGTGREAPIAIWLSLGPQSQASVTVSFPGTYKSFTLTRVQVARLGAALDKARAILARDDGDSPRRIATNLLEGIDA